LGYVLDLFWHLRTPTVCQMIPVSFAYILGLFYIYYMPLLIHSYIPQTLLTTTRAHPDGQWRRTNKTAPCPLLIAAEHGHTDIVTNLLYAGATLGAV